MTAPAETTDDLTRVLALALQRYVNTTERDVIPLDEVAQRTGMSHRAILNDCRAGRVEHVHRGNLWGMTQRQIALLIERYSSGGDPHQPTEVSGLDAARAATRNGAARRASRRAA